MKAIRVSCTLLAVLAAGSGCSLVPKNRLNSAEAQSRSLGEQNRALAAQLENLNIHTRNVEDKLIRAEEELAVLEEEIGLDSNQLADYRRERKQLHEQMHGITAGCAGLPDEIGRQLADLSEKYACLHFDPVTGISKLDTDILFDSGSAKLKPGAEKVLGELARILNGTGARDLKVLVVGHTDNQKIIKKTAQEKYANNFHLSTARANAVADLMRRQGVKQQRLGVAGFGPHQPIAPNVTSKDRQKNRRVEIFVMAPDVPVVGWTDSIPSVY